jgi:hypothetical protein
MSNILLKFQSSVLAVMNIYGWTTSQENNTAITVLLEDFKARWQELLNTGAEVSTWSTVYYTGLVLTIGWVLGRKSREGVTELFSNDKPIETFLVLSLVLVNAIYILGISVKSYHIQQIALYLYEVVDKRISLLSGVPFNSWEEWRRVAFQSSGSLGRPEDVRTIYYFLMLLLPVGVSASILGMYLKHRKPWRAYWRKGGNQSRKSHIKTAGHLLNLYFIGVLLINLIAIGLTVYLIVKMNNMWAVRIQERQGSILSVPGP